VHAAQAVLLGEHLARLVDRVLVAFELLDEPGALRADDGPSTSLTSLDDLLEPNDGTIEEKIINDNSGDVGFSEKSIDNAAIIHAWIAIKRILMFDSTTTAKTTAAAADDENRVVAALRASPYISPIDTLFHQSPPTIFRGLYLNCNDASARVNEYYTNFFPPLQYVDYVKSFLKIPV
jgi:hypothetical protein